MKKTPNFYELLQVSSSASAEEIKKSFRKLALVYHPDKNPGKEQLFKDISAAYKTLSHSATRKSYDLKIGIGKKATPPPKTTNKSGPAAATTPLSQGKNLIFHLNLTLQEAFSGCEREVSYVRNFHGSRQTARITVPVPPGIRDEKKLRIRGAGEALSARQVPGDLVVVVHLLPHENYTLDGSDIILKFPLSPLDLLCLEPLRVPTLHGEILINNLDFDEFGHATAHLVGKGFPHQERSSLFGDQFVRFLVDVPPHLDENLKNKLLQIKKILPKSAQQKEIESLLESK